MIKPSARKNSRWLVTNGYLFDLDPLKLGADLLLFLVERLVVAREFLLELLDATHAVDELLLTSIERVRST